MKIGVFDSGVGGQSMAAAIRRAFPDYRVEVVEDAKNLPYGTKSPEQLLQLTRPILQKMARRCDVIVIACNTLTTNCIEELRKQVPVPLVGLEPMVKPAAKLTDTGVIAVCATPATLASKRYLYLKKTYATAHKIRIIEPDCSRWAQLIQDKGLDRTTIGEPIDQACKQQADVIVLGCTHYHWIEELVREVAGGRAIVIQPEQAVVKQLWRVLRDLKQPV